MSDINTNAVLQTLDLLTRNGELRDYDDELANRLEDAKDIVRSHATLTAQLAEAEARGMRREVDIVFDGPPGPEAGRFVEVESPPGTGISLGKWIQREDGYWVLRIEALAERTKP